MEKMKLVIAMGFFVLGSGCFLQAWLFEAESLTEDQEVPFGRTGGKRIVIVDADEQPAYPIITPGYPKRAESFSEMSEDVSSDARVPEMALKQAKSNMVTKPVLNIEELVQASQQAVVELVPAAQSGVSTQAEGDSGQSDLAIGLKVGYGVAGLAFVGLVIYGMLTDYLAAHPDMPNPGQELIKAEAIRLEKTHKLFEGPKLTAEEFQQKQQAIDAELTKAQERFESHVSKLSPELRQQAIERVNEFKELSAKTPVVKRIMEYHKAGYAGYSNAHHEIEMAKIAESAKLKVSQNKLRATKEAWLKEQRMQRAKAAHSAEAKRNAAARQRRLLMQEGRR